MEPATYQIPLILKPPKQPPWTRLYHTPTMSSKGRMLWRDFRQLSNQDSLSWCLKSEYDHAKDLFFSKAETYQRSEAVSAKPSGAICPRQEVKCMKSSTAVNIRSRNSMKTSSTYSHEELYNLSAPKAKNGYARNPNGAFFTT